MKLLRPLRERDFALLWTGMTISLLGDGIFIVAEAWQVYDIDNDPVALSLVGLAWTGGMTAFLLTGGIVSDRVERRKVLIAADLVRALVLAGVLPVIVCVVLCFAAGLRRDEELHPLLGDYAGVGASAADSGSGTPAIS